MAIGRRGRGRRATRRRNRAEDEARAQQAIYDDAYAKEQKRLEAERKRELQSQVFATTEGEGVMEGATLSLGFDDEEEDTDFMGTGLVI